MTKLYDGTRNKLDYICTKLRNVVNDYYYEDIRNPRFTPNIEAVSVLEDELDIIETIANNGYCDSVHWPVVHKYLIIADEFRAVRAIR